MYIMMLVTVATCIMYIDSAGGNICICIRFKEADQHQLPVRASEANNPREQESGIATIAMSEPTDTHIHTYINTHTHIYIYAHTYIYIYI